MQIPKMLLQPLVENAVYHGIEEMAEDTNIYIKGILVDEENCTIEVSDAGRGTGRIKKQNIFTDPFYRRERSWNRFKECAGQSTVVLWGTVWYRDLFQRGMLYEGTDSFTKKGSKI